MPRSRINEPIQKKRYNDILIRMMSFLNRSVYPEDKQVSTSKLSHLQPHNVFRLMTLRVYGTDDPTDDDHPTE
eukprot:7481750-Ditylum_brightwellii.AAC.1